MIIQMAWQMSGGRYDDRPWPPPWTDFEVPDEEGRGLVSCGAATEVVREAPAQAAPVKSAPAPSPPVSPAGDEDDDDEGEVPAESPVVTDGTTVPLPAPDDPKSAWIKYAVSLGFSQEEAGAMTLAHLKMAFGGRL